MTTRPLPVIRPDISAILENLGHVQPFEVTVAGSAGSGRVYWRIGAPPQSHILLVSHREDADYERFLSVSRHLRRVGFAVPEIHGSDDAVRQVVLEDLGSELLLSRAHSQGFPGAGDLEALENDYEIVVDALVDWQLRGTPTMADCPSLTDRVFDREALTWETGYFAHRCAQDAYGLPARRLEDPALQAELHALALRVEGHERVLMHRDFQSQNLMWRDGKPWFIDYQGARAGSRWYDLASLLWDPYVQIPMNNRFRLFLRYCDRSPVADGPLAWQQLQDAALQRVMQALGAYGYLSGTKGLPWFRQFLVPALASLGSTLEERGDMPALSALVREMQEKGPRDS
ncbi:MAG: phosphotransferase [Fibrobacteria bacterium]|nr:phosphotransferase [Fibrobacteria bacterium]